MTDPIILIVSRDADARIIFGTALSSAGYRVELVADPDSALDVARAARAALVVTNHPTLLSDGRTVTQALRADGATANLPVLNATSHVLDDELARARADGVDLSLPLPLPPAVLVAAVRDLLALRAAGGATPDRALS